ncbi:MAG: aconitate hydratase [Saccharofermentanaceae bacterium]|jgi:aconitate hydratase|nr:aconitate hydratase [Clostridia bacterium]NLX68853.1 aconitate hydratase [Clostridiaceae bacterium]HOO49364.1 aconitate hydratase [Saccharofermentans sp.]HPG64764.1 aconitate hydratase [Saccharofermentans sp.]HPQ31712.1 aconitate hydratase [Saccharofermentans sp.]
MGLTISQKIIKNHLISGEMKVGEEISLRIDQTLTQDSTGTMAYLQFEAIGVPQVKTKLSVAYIDHNMLQSGFENADDHKYIQTVTSKHGIRFSRPGNGVCHQVHVERFGIPGQTLLGSDSHTPTCGGIGMLAIGAGGLDVAVAMGGGPYFITMPKMVRITLKNKLSGWSSAKDIILEVLRRMTVKGGVGKIIEYAGEGVDSLSVPERATITNMGAELGATTSVFPSDDVTKAFLKAQGREEAWIEIKADTDAIYDEEIEIDLATLNPLIAKPHMPDLVVPVSEIAGTKVDQVCIGSCTNSSLFDMLKVAKILEGHTVNPDVSLVIAPGSKQVFNMLAECGALATMIASGARILECACGPCIGMGQSPKTDAVSLRTNNRNFYARSGTASASIYLVSPEVAAVASITGVITNPKDFGQAPVVTMPTSFKVNDNMVIMPSTNPNEVEVVRGPNIKPFPINTALPENVSGKTLIKLEDNITTDHIMPSNSKLLPFRSNVPHLANFCLTPCDPDFPARAKENNGGFIIGGSNYGQGSSREHAALAPLQLGVKGVIAISFARIHMANLINNGILPLTFADSEDYNKLDMLDDLVIENCRKQVEDAVEGKLVVVKNITKGTQFNAVLSITNRQAGMLLAGGLLKYTRERS